LVIAGIVNPKHHTHFVDISAVILAERGFRCGDVFNAALFPGHRIPSRPPSLFLWGRTCASAGGQKALQCILQLSKCPPAGAMETKMAAGWEYD
jgi:hypothetical protein